MPLLLHGGTVVSIFSLSQYARLSLYSASVWRLWQVQPVFYDPDTQVNNVLTQYGK